MIASPTSRTCATNSSVVSSTRKPGIDSSLSSVPPVWPSPRPLIFPNGTPHAATIGPTAIDVLSPTPPVECLSTHRAAELAARGRVVSPLAIIASVSANVSRARQAAEVDRHAERGHLVVGHLAARVAEHELARARRRRAPRRPACARSARPGGSRLRATKIDVARAARASGPSSTAARSARCAVAIERARRSSRTASPSGNVTVPSASRRSTLREVRAASAAAPFSR